MESQLVSFARRGTPAVLYNHPENPEAFDRHYREVHAPLAAKAPGLKSYTMSFCHRNALNS